MLDRQKTKRQFGPKVYLAAPFRSLSKRTDESKAYGVLETGEFTELLEKLESLFLARGFTTCLPHRDEGHWGKSYYEPGPLSAICFRHVETSDFIFAIAENGRGVHLEVGFGAASPDKAMLLVCRDDHEPSTLIWGIPLLETGLTGESVPRRLIARYKNQTSLLQTVDDLLEQEFKLPRTHLPAARKSVGLIDIGSHTIKAKVISHIEGNAAQVIWQDKKSLGIMSSVLFTGALSDQDSSSVLQLIAEWSEKFKSLEASSVKVVGTAALRKALNSEDLLALIRKQFGFTAQILTPEKELDYVDRAVRRHFLSSIRLGVLNLGGGSTQLSLGGASTPRQEFFLDFGTKQVTDRFPWTGPFSDQTYGALMDFVKNHIETRLPSRATDVERLVHTGGELDFLLRCQVPLATCNYSPSHVSEIGVDRFRQFADEFRRLTPEVVASRYSLDPSWAAGSVASNAIALALADSIGASVIVPSNLNVSDGLILD